MAEFFRVRDKRTGHEYTTARVTDDHEVIDKRAVNANGKPLPGKPRTSIAKKAAAASKTSESSKSSGDEPADNPPEEGSK